jgi:hypothetical protein
MLLQPLPLLTPADTAALFLRCRGPSNSSLATFVLEADAGAAAASLFGLQDELAKAGRRSCAYDRLGLGWSDDIIMPGHLKRVGRAECQQLLKLVDIAVLDALTACC